jgi:hypothetical protein
MLQIYYIEKTPPSRIGEEELIAYFSKNLLPFRQINPFLIVTFDVASTITCEFSSIITFPEDVVDVTSRPMATLSPQKYESCVIVIFWIYDVSGTQYSTYGI